MIGGVAPDSAWARGIVFVWGLVAGSFLSLAVDRLPQGLSVVRPGSHCPQCGHQLGFAENLPLAGFLWLRGRCRRCRGPIAGRDPALELGCGLLFLWSWARTGGGAAFVETAVFLCFLLALAASDWEWRELPDELTLGGWAAGLVFSIWFAPGWLASLLTSGIAAGALALVALAYQRLSGRAGLGWGDVKMLGMLGAFLGPHDTVVAFFLACVLASLAGLAQAAVIFFAHRWSRPRSSWGGARARAAVFLRHGTLPLGLFLALGAGLALPWGPSLFRLWMG